ncbi:MAG TPA: hypothetical protein VFY47_02190 [Thermoleophilaceae bacterium]|nr:hypothetical protein [Thermoleophilaceae bacterium]
MKNESLMDRTGLGLLPGLVLALGLVVFAMAFLLMGSMWAVFGVLALIVIVAMAVVAAVVALVDEDGELGTSLRQVIPGMASGTRDSSRPLEHN